MSKIDNHRKLSTALSFHQAGRLREAAQLYREVITAEAENADALHYLGLVETNLGNYHEARSLLERSLALRPTNVQFIENCATTLFQLMDYGAAVELAHRGLRIDGRNLSLSYVRAISLFKLRRYADAVAQFDKILKLTPNHVAAVNERGAALAELKDYDAALAAFENALALHPQYAEAYLNKGNVLGILRRHSEALAAYDDALALKREMVDAWTGRANVLTQLERFDDALRAYDVALNLNAAAFAPWMGKASVFERLRRNDEALQCYDRALALQPDLAAGWLGRGNMLAEKRNWEDAFRAYDRAVELKPDVYCGEGARFFAKLNLCDWTALHEEAAKLSALIKSGVPAISPFVLLAAASGLDEQLQATRQFVNESPRFEPIWRAEVYSHKRIKVAYFSADLREHAVAYLMAGLFEHHDKVRFEVTALSTGADASSATQQRIKRSVEHFIDLSTEGDDDIAEFIRRNEIDILVDLMGFTTFNRYGIMARRPAPIQINYLGYSATMGADCLDYIIADATVIPEEHCGFYAERVIWLPDCYLVNDDKRKIAESTPTRSACALPEDAFVFCCFNNSYKFGPEIFAIWMRLLQAVPGSVLWLSEANGAARANLRQATESASVAADRLIFAPRMVDVADHLARQRHADLFLDTLPYNAHTTACDALWAGVPVLTCIGTTFVGRVAASLLKAVGLDELVTHSSADYESLALKLARDRTALAFVRDKLARNRNTSPLFDTARTTRQIEAAYTMMWERYQRGEPARLAGDPRPMRIE